MEIKTERKLERTKNAKRNFTFGMIHHTITIILPFLLRTIMINALGIEYAGVSSLFTSILQVLSLTELGFGTSIVFCMYKPIAEKDEKTICSLLNFYRKCYFVIGTSILVIGLCLTPFIPRLIAGEIPSDLNIYYVYWIRLIATVVTYYAFSYKGALLTAYQRNDVKSIVYIFSFTIEYVLQIVLMLIYHNYYVYLVINPVTTIITNTVIAIITTKLFPQYTPTGKIDKEEKNLIVRKVKSAFLYRIGNVVSNSVDSIFVSAYLGLAIEAMYHNYYYVISSLFTILAVYYDSMTAGIGNKMVLESKKENYKLFENLFFMQGWMIGWMSICLLCLFQDFISAWVGAKYTFEFPVIILLSVYFYSWKVNDIAYIFKDAAGMWEYDRFNPLISSILNLAINLMLIRKIGIYAVIISTIVCDLTLSLFWGVGVLFKYYFEISFFEYLKKYIRYTIINIGLAIITFCTCSFVSTGNYILNMFIKAIICLVLPNVIFMLINVKNKKLRWVIKEVLIKFFKRA